MILAHATGALASWKPMVAMGIGFLAVLALLAARGEGSRGWDAVVRPGRALERITGIEAWAASLAALSLFGLMVAGIGFYSDVAWHVDLGRDKQLFTAPHTMIVVGLGLIALAALAAIVVATVTKVDRGFRAGPVQVPWAALAMGVLGFTALSGFPLDEMWHIQYGVDVTMWSPTHLIMICGASLSPIPAWLGLAEAGSRPSMGRWHRALHAISAWLLLAGLASVLGEFEFGVPQFQQLYHPVLVALAAGVALTAGRLVLGRGWIFLSVLMTWGFRMTSAIDPSGDNHVLTRPAAIYLGSAIAVELAALVVGTERRLRFALTAGAGIATLGMAGEWIWNGGAHQPWTAALLPAGIVVPALVAVSAAVVGTAFASRLRGDGPVLPRPAVALAFLGLLAGMLLPLPRTDVDATARVTLEPAAGGNAVVRATVEPPSAAEDARWFQVSAWQGGGLVLSDMERQGDGSWRSAEAVPVHGSWKTLLRIHKGSAMVAVPVYLPADPEINEPEIPAVDRTAPFVAEQEYLLREAHGGSPWFMIVAYAIIAGIAATWIASIGMAARKLPVTTAPDRTLEELPA